MDIGNALINDQSIWNLTTGGNFSCASTGGGGIVRNKNEDMITAYAYPTQFLTNNISEAQAVLIGIKWCCEQEFSCLDLELHFMIIDQTFQ